MILALLSVNLGQAQRDPVRTLRNSAGPSAKQHQPRRRWGLLSEQPSVELHMAMLVFNFTIWKN